MSLFLNSVLQTLVFMGTAVIVFTAVNYLLEERKR